MNINNFTQQLFHSQPSNFYDSLLSLEKFIDKKHAFDDFAHLVFKAPLFEDLMAVVSVYTGAFGPMTDREIAMVQKRMYQLNRQTVRAMHEIINQKQLIAGINSKETNIHSTVSKTPPSVCTSSFGSMNMNTTPLPQQQHPAMTMDLHHSPLPMTPRPNTSQHFGNFLSHHANDLPTTILNTPVQTPTGPDRFHCNKQVTASAGKTTDFDRPSLSVQEFLRMQQTWANSILNSKYAPGMNDSMHTPSNTASLAMLDSNVAAAAAAAFFMASPAAQSPCFPMMTSGDRSPFIPSNGCIGDDSGRMRMSTSGQPKITTRRRLRSETALLDM